MLRLRELKIVESMDELETLILLLSTAIHTKLAI